MRVHESLYHKQPKSRQKDQLANLISKACSHESGQFLKLHIY